MISTGALSSPLGIRIPHSFSRGALVRPYQNLVLKYHSSSARQSSALRLRPAHPTLSRCVLENRNNGCSTEARAGSEETIRENHDNVRRRFLLLTLPAAATFVFPQLVPDSSSAASAIDFPFLRPMPSLSDRLTSEIVRNPGTAFLGPRQLYYPDWLFGTWQVDATLESFSTPLGTEFVSPRMLREATDPQFGVGTRVSYQEKFYSTLADTWQNQARVALGSLPQSRIVADRAFNATSAYNAHLGYDGVDQSEYDSRKDPTRLTVVFSTKGAKGEEVSPKRQELLIQNRSSEVTTDGDFLCSESFQCVSIGVRSEEVSDSEVVCRFHQVSPYEVRAHKRKAIYLQPQEPNFFDAWGRAVVLLDYDLRLTKAMGADNCVLTPKGVTQCTGFT